MVSYLEVELHDDALDVFIDLNDVGWVVIEGSGEYDGPVVGCRRSCVVWWTKAGLMVRVDGSI